MPKIPAPVDIGRGLAGRNATGLRLPSGESWQNRNLRHHDAAGTTGSDAAPPQHLTGPHPHLGALTMLSPEVYILFRRVAESGSPAPAAPCRAASLVPLASA